MPACMATTVQLCRMPQTNLSGQGQGKCITLHLQPQPDMQCGQYATSMPQCAVGTAYSGQ